MRSILLFLFVVLFSNQSIAQGINPCEDSLYKELYKKAKSGLILTPTQGLYLMLRSSECSLNKPFDYRVTKDIVIEGCDNLEFAKAYAKYKKDLKLNNEEKEVLKKNYKECEPLFYKDYILPKNGKLANYVKIINLDAAYVTFFLPENQTSLDDTLNSIRRMSVSTTDKIGYYSAYSNETIQNDKTLFYTYNNWVNRKANINSTSQSDNGIPIKVNDNNQPLQKVDLKLPYVNQKFRNAGKHMLIANGLIVASGILAYSSTKITLPNNPTRDDIKRVADLQSTLNFLSGASGIASFGFSVSAGINIYNGSIYLK